MSAEQWIAGINAVAAALEHDAENVREVLIEAGAQEPAPDRDRGAGAPPDIDVRRVATQALDGVVGNLRHQGVVARYAAAKTYDENDLQALIEAAEGGRCCWCSTACRTRTTSAPACAARRRPVRPR